MGRWVRAGVGRGSGGHAVRLQRGGRGEPRGQPRGQRRRRRCGGDLRVARHGAGGPRRLARSADAAHAGAHATPSPNIIVHLSQEIPTCACVCWSLYVEPHTTSGTARCQEVVHRLAAAACAAWRVCCTCCPFRGALPQRDMHLNTSGHSLALVCGHVLSLWPESNIVLSRLTRVLRSTWP